LEKKRPLGVTIVAILMIIGGIALLFSFHPVSIALAIANFIVAWGLLTGKGWAWLITVILAIISIVFSIVSIVIGMYGSIVSLIIEGIILYYMFRPSVKSYFGRSVSISK
jgi:hypothetical protein